MPGLLYFYSPRWSSIVTPAGRFDAQWNQGTITPLQGAVGTFTRSTAANYWDDTQLRTAAASNVARFDHPIDDAMRGVLIERAVTNYVSNPRTFTAASWEKRNCTLGALSTDTAGTNTAQVVVGGNSTTLAPGLRQTLAANAISSSDDTVTFCANVRKDNWQYVYVAVRAEDGAEGVVIYNLDMDLPRSINAASGLVTKYGCKFKGNDYYELKVTFKTRGNAASQQLFVQIGPARNETQHVFSDGSGLNKRLIISEAWLTKSDYPLYYVDSFKAADTLTYPVAGNFSRINYQMILSVFHKHVPHGTAERYLFAMGELSIRMTDTAIRAYVSPVDYIEYNNGLTDGGMYNIGLDHRSGAGLQLWVNRTMYDSNATNAFTRELSLGATAYVGSDWFGANQADCIYSSLRVEPV